MNETRAPISLDASLSSCVRIGGDPGTVAIPLEIYNFNGPALSSLRHSPLRDIFLEEERGRVVIINDVEYQVYDYEEHREMVLARRNLAA